MPPLSSPPDQSHSTLRRAFTNYQAHIIHKHWAKHFPIVPQGQLCWCTAMMDVLMRSMSPSFSFPCAFQKPGNFPPKPISIINHFLEKRERPEHIGGYFWFGTEWGKGFRTFISHETQLLFRKGKLRKPYLWTQWGQVTVITEVSSPTLHSVEPSWASWREIKTSSLIHLKLMNVHWES
jgi:hypothetical protein